MPNTLPANTDLVVYQLTDEDRKFKSKVRLGTGASSDEDLVFHRMCIMQLVAMMTSEADKVSLIEKAKEIFRKMGRLEKKHAFGEEYRALEDEVNSFMLDTTDHPICVGEALRDALISLNDAITNNRERARLKTVVDDIINTCPVQRTVKHYKTKGDVVIEKRKETPEYRAAERQREEMLAPVRAWRPGAYTRYGEKCISLGECLKLIREAAALFVVQPHEMPGTANNPITKEA